MKTRTTIVLLMVPVILAGCAFSIGSSKKEVHYVPVGEKAAPAEFRSVGGWIERIDVPAGRLRGEAAERAFRRALDADTADEAEDLLRESIEACPTAAALNDMGCLLEARGLPAGAEGWYRAALAVEAGNAVVLANLDRVR